MAAARAAPARDAETGTPRRDVRRDVDDSNSRVPLVQPLRDDAREDARVALSVPPETWRHFDQAPLSWLLQAGLFFILHIATIYYVLSTTYVVVFRATFNTADCDGGFWIIKQMDKIGVPYWAPFVIAEGYLQFRFLNDRITAVPHFYSRHFVM